MILILQTANIVKLSFIVSAYLVFLLSGNIASVRADSIRGIVQDSVSSEPLMGAVVFISGKYAGTTDAEGVFELPLPAVPGPFILRVSLLGYTDKILSVSPAEKIRILLVPSSRFMDPVVISAARSGERLIRSTVSMQSIQPYLIQNRISVNMEEVLNQVPGVHTVDGQVNIRSGSGWSYGAGSRVAVLVDGMPMMGAGTGQVLWNYLPLENVEQVEVLKGASGVLYGSSALNGIVNIRTKWPGNKTITSASVFSGVYDAFSGRDWNWQGNRVLMKSGGHFLYGKGTDKMQYVLSTHLLKDDSYRMSDQDQRGRVSLKTRFFSKDKTFYWGVNANAMMARTASFLLWDSYDKALTSLSSQVTENASLRWNIDPHLVKYQGDFTHHLNARVLLADNRIQPSGGGQDQSNRSTLYYSEYRLESAHFRKQGWLLNAGLVASYGITVAEMFSGNKTNSNLASYLHADYQKKSLTLNFGARYERYHLGSYSSGRPVYRAGASYGVGKATYFRASAGQGFRFPVVAEAFIKTSAGPVFIFPNPDLKAESGTNAELGLRQGFRLGGVNLLLDLAAYRMNFENMMEFSFGQWEEATPANNFGFGFKSVNIGKARVDGLEISLSAAGKWKKSGIKTIIGYNYADPRNMDPHKIYAHSVSSDLSYSNTSSDPGGTILKYRSRHLFKSDVQWDFRRVLLGASYRYTSAIEAIDNVFEAFPFNAYVPGIKAAREDFSGGAHIFDLRASYLASSDYKISLMIGNLFNTASMTRPADIRPPRTFTLQLSYKY
jgi:outer membrane receptor for ferrienterochelin and colicins